MTFTYTLADLTSGDTVVLGRALIRTRIGDVISAGHDLEDEELDPIVTVWGESRASAALAAVNYALAKRANRNDTSGAGINNNRSQRFEQLLKLKRELELEAAGELTGVIVTVTPAEVRVAQTDTAGQVAPVFYVGMDRYR